MPRHGCRSGFTFYRYKKRDLQEVQVLYCWFTKRAGFLANLCTVEPLSFVCSCTYMCWGRDCRIRHDAGDTHPNICSKQYAGTRYGTPEYNHRRAPTWNATSWCPCGDSRTSQSGKHQREPWVHINCAVGIQGKGIKASVRAGLPCSKFWGKLGRQYSHDRRLSYT